MPSHDVMQLIMDHNGLISYIYIHYIMDDSDVGTNDIS